MDLTDKSVNRPCGFQVSCNPTDQELVAEWPDLLCLQNVVSADFRPKGEKSNGRKSKERTGQIAQSGGGQFPVTRAGSDGRRNTCLQFTRRSLES
jgi:hypothetical protein